MQTHEWDGVTTIPRTDGKGVRPATRLVCEYCGQEFLRAFAYIDPTVPRTACSVQHSRWLKDPPILRLCMYCGQQFQVYKEHGQGHKRTCCDACANAVVRPAPNRSMALIAWAYEHGIEGDHKALKCDFCGQEQKREGRSKIPGNSHWRVRLTVRNHRYVAMCKRCYEAERRGAAPDSRLEAGKALDTTRCGR